MLYSLVYPVAVEAAGISGFGSRIKKRPWFGSYTEAAFRFVGVGAKSLG